MLKRILLAFIVCASVLIFITLIINLGMILSARRYIFSEIDTIPKHTAVMVLGSQTHGTRLSPVLQDRVDAGITLVQKHEGMKLLLSGDSGKGAGGSRFYDEVNAMWLYVLENGSSIREEDIFLDHAGFSTWESMYRAREIFEIQDMIIVTQEFHISRAVSMARSLGINAIGYGIYEGRFRGPSLRSWQFREYFARIKGLYSIVFRPEPQILGNQIPISGDGRASWQ